MRILVVEDEPRIAADIREGLERAGYVAEIVGDGEAAWFRAETETYDAMVLDLGLPRLDGLGVLRRLRGADVALPVLILTARDGWRERVEGIDAPGPQNWNSGNGPSAPCSSSRSSAGLV